jgi:folate-binding protein YgfZ
MGGDDNWRMSREFEGGTAALPHWGVLHAEGVDAAAFLQTQLTNDVTSLAADGARLAGYCSAKGRLLATFVVWRPRAESVYLACSADLLATTSKRLSMFVLRAKCRLTAEPDLQLYGLAGAAVRRALPAAADMPPWSHRVVQQASLLRLPDAGSVPRWLWIGAEAPPAMPALSREAWDRLEVESGIPRVVAGTVERFVPQMLNFEAIGGVDFRKGCYPGQEVVARSQYRGTIKRRTLRYDADGAAAPGDDVFAAGQAGEPAGVVVNAAEDSSNGRSALLVEVKLALADAELHLRDIAGPLLVPAALPYALPTEAA